MNDQPAVSALRVSDEAFLVASMIERCPKTMMLRELVMNALEAARNAPVGQVCIDTVSVDGVPKLRIWNNGPGMTADQLYRVCDLASSLNKTTGLDDNFGMGAKVASLPSNKRGLRYRSCHAGVVSQALLGQSGGVYGRLRLGDAQQDVADVTQAVRAEEERDLGEDWTEVVLFGNSAGQNTAADPYAGDPSVPSRWIPTYLSQRFFHLVGNTGLTLGAQAIGAEMDEAFIPINERMRDLTQIESVPSPGGIMIHYGYQVPDEASAKSIFTGGFAGVVHRGEIYGIRDGTQWVYDGPTFGFPFGARYCTVLVELPATFGVRPEAYRQFLRFRDGDQRQVLLSDFAALVRAHIPTWLRDLIASYGPPQIDYLREVSEELAELLSELGVPARSRNAHLPRGATDEAAVKAPQEPRPPAPPVFEPPPEIIALHDEELIGERGLQGRAARYYGDSHQMFVNMNYAAAMRIAGQLQAEFGQLSDTGRVEDVAKQMAEWAVTRKIGHSLVYTLSKRTLGWTSEEIGRAQSPEALSIVADDHSLILPLARRRMAEILGVALSDTALGGARPALSWDQRLSAASLEAQQAAARATATPNMTPGPLMRRVSEIEARRRNFSAAIEWAEKAVREDESDPFSHSHHASVLQQSGDFAAAERAALMALERRRPDMNPARFQRQLSSIAGQQGNLDLAIDWARQAVSSDPNDPWAHNQLSGVLEQMGQFLDAEVACRAALDAVGPGGSPVALLRRLSHFIAQQSKIDEAILIARKAIVADQNDPWSHLHLSGLLQRTGDFEAAKVAAREALELSDRTATPGRFLRELSIIAIRQQNIAEAVEIARAAVETDPDDLACLIHFAEVLLQAGRLDEAAEMARRALMSTGSGGNPTRTLRLLSTIAVRRNELPEAIAFAHDAVEADPNDAWSRSHLADLMLRSGDLDAARSQTEMALSVLPASVKSARFKRQLSDIEAKRGNLPEAIRWSEEAVVADPLDIWSFGQLANLLQRTGDLKGAEQALSKAVSIAEPGVPRGRMLRQLSSVAMAQRDPQRAILLAREAVDNDPADPWMYNHLSGLLLQIGDVDGAALAAGDALRRAAPESKEQLNARLNNIEARRKSAA